MILLSLRLSVAVVTSLLLLQSLLAPESSVVQATTAPVGNGNSNNGKVNGWLHFHGDDAVKLTRSKLYRFRQQCKREKLRKRRERYSRQHEKSTKSPGSFLSLTTPTPERVSQWFGGGRRRGGASSSSSCKLASERRIVFNHDAVGMTNPCLHVRRDDDDDGDDFVRAGKEAENLLLRQEERGPTSLQEPRSTDDDENNTGCSSSSSSWWPSCAWLEQQQLQKPQDKTSSSSASSSSSWRVLRYHRQVGVGSACYEKAKEAALAWEFADGDRRQGLVSVKNNNFNKNRFDNIDDTDDDESSSSRYNTIRLGPGYRVLSLPPTVADCEQVESDVSSFKSSSSSMVDGTSSSSSSSSNGETRSNTMIWSQGGRRLATFTRCLPILRCCFAVNPVAVVYDIVDQQGGPGGDTMYTSTAYATCQGHWFRGEERVTVALRRRRSRKSNSPTTRNHPVLQPQQQQQQHQRPMQATAVNDDDDDGGGVVDVEILSISKPANSVMGRVAWALSSRLQHRFFEAQLDALERQAQQQQQPQQRNQ